MGQNAILGFSFHSSPFFYRGPARWVTRPHLILLSGIVLGSPLNKPTQTTSESVCEELSAHCLNKTLKAVNRSGGGHFGAAKGEGGHVRVLGLSGFGLAGNFLSSPTSSVRSERSVPNGAH